MQDAPFGVGGKQLPQFPQIAGQVVVLPDGGLEDPAAQRGDLVVKKAGFIIVVQKIELYLFPVDGTVDVHHEGLHAARVHGGHDLQYTNGSHVYSSASSRVRQSFSSALASSRSRG